MNTGFVNTSTTTNSLGTATYYDLNLTASFAGVVCASSTSAVLFARYIASTSNLTFGNIGGSTNPFGAAWASGDLITFNFSYPVA